MAVTDARISDLPDLGVGFPTVAAMARERALTAPRQVAMREKDSGIWHEYTWSDTWERVLDAAHGLLALGVDVGDRVCIHSEDRPHWIVLDLATVAVRAVTVGLYPTNPTAEVRYLLADSESAVLLAEDQEQVDKALAVDRSEAPSLHRIIYVEPRGVRQYDDDRLLSWRDFLELGRRHRAERPGEVERRMAGAEGGDVMTIVYTSGTTGPPKGAMLTNDNAAFCIERIVADGERLDGWRLFLTHTGTANGAGGALTCGGVPTRL